MSRVSKEQQDIMDNITALIEMLDSYKGVGEFDSAEMTLSPIQLLIWILQSCGVKYEKLVEWITTILVGVIPVLEITIKGALLVNLKYNIDCNLDPRIPEKFRERIGGCQTIPFLSEDIWEKTENNEDSQRGFEIDIKDIDTYGMLKESPISDIEKFNYFGTKKYYEVYVADEKRKKTFYQYKRAVDYCKEYKIDVKKIIKRCEIDSIYELVRAEDMNAFIWFVKNKARFFNTAPLNSDIVNKNKKTILDCIEGVAESGQVDLGQVYTQENKTNQFGVMGMCIKNTAKMELEDWDGDEGEKKVVEISDDEKGAYEIQKYKSSLKDYNYTIVPITNVWNGLNWYVNRKHYYTYLTPSNDDRKKIGIKKTSKKRDYQEDFALFNLSTKLNGENESSNTLVLKIKPAPNLLTPDFGYKVDMRVKNKRDVSEGGKEGEEWKDEKLFSIKYSGTMPYTFRRLVFDSDAKPKFTGKYSIVLGDNDRVRSEKDKRNAFYVVKNPITNLPTNVRLRVGVYDMSYELIGGDDIDIKSVLYECYPGFTMYEFFYDLVMGIKFFDSTVITAKLIETFTNIQYKASINKEDYEYQERISKIITKTLNAQGFESKDCFYSFSNDDYDEMMSKSEQIRSNMYNPNINTSDLYSTLNEFNDNATLEENVSVLTRIINQVEDVDITDENFVDEKYKFKHNLIYDMISNLTGVLLKALVTPKLMLIMKISEQATQPKQSIKEEIGDGEDKDAYKEKYKELAKDYGKKVFQQSYKGIEKLIEKFGEEIGKIIVQKLLNYVLNELKSLMGDAMQLLLKEQLEYYQKLWSQLIKACSFNLPKGLNLESTLDDVTYADIDDTSLPASNEC